MELRAWPAEITETTKEEPTSDATSFHLCPPWINLFKIGSRADEIGETEGKAAMGSGEQAGKRVSFNWKSAIANSYLLFKNKDDQFRTGA